ELEELTHCKHTNCLSFIGNSIAMAPKGNQTFCRVLHPGKYCCARQYMFPDGATEATESNV
uniref:Uncharacterized protein n=1 Tax=Zosterops lateralis melanops TaxID=1220523 RepID=A0A8D2P357_ZOSLA